jgi:plastocyanin
MRPARLALPLAILLAGCGSEGPPALAADLPACGDPSAVSTLAPSAEGERIRTPGEIAPDDRVGFPEDYRDSFRQFYVFDRFDAGLISYVCANEVATTVEEGAPFPYSSILLSETWRPLRDEDGDLVADDAGRLIRSELVFALLMRKEPGFGEMYGSDRSGEWEYNGFLPDGSYQARPEQTASCAACHAVAAGEHRDWVFRPELHFVPDRYARTDPVEEGKVGVSRMAYHPATRTARVGETVEWVNSTVDDTPHTVTEVDGAFASGVLAPGESFAHTFTEPGRVEYTCALHPQQMRGVIEVIE